MAETRAADSFVVLVWVGILGRFAWLFIERVRARIDRYRRTKMEEWQLRHVGYAPGFEVLPAKEDRSAGDGSAKHRDTEATEREC